MKIFKNGSASRHNKNQHTKIAQRNTGNLIICGVISFRSLALFRIIISKQRFLDNAALGAVYVCFGTCSIARETIDVLIKSFSQIQQAVLWEHDETLTDLPSNIAIRNKLSHNSILAHENIRLLITNGDASVLKLALFYGIPILIIPFENNQVGEM